MTQAANECELVLTHVLNAPRALVWKVWTEDEHMAEWYGPKGFNTRVEANDLRPGGAWRYVMIGPDGAEYPSVGVFREIVPLERIVSTDDFGDREEMKKKVADLPEGMVVTTIFEDEGTDKTKVTVRIMHPTAEERRKHEEMGVVAGWNSMLDCLDDYLADIQN